MRFPPTLTLLACLSWASPALAASQTAKPKMFSIPLSPAELAQEKVDEAKYPSFTKFLKTLNLTGGLKPSDPRNAHLIPTTHVSALDTAEWGGFWKAAAADKMTCLRALAIFARKIKKEGVVVFGPGAPFENSVAENHIDLGLALPATHLGSGVWVPDPARTDPEFLLHIKVFYTESYVHRFPDEILPANLKIGFGDPETYWLDGKEYKQPTVEADIVYGPTKGVGFRDVKGVGGRKRGLMGVLQSVMFFLPDAVTSMVIREKEDELVTEAIINTTVKDFEKTPIYSIKIR